MRTIILGLLGATMLSSVAQAACNDIPNPTRFNPTELSAYQECWLDEYKADETAGIIGSLAWVRLDGQYFSASLSAIRSMKGSDYADKFISAIENDLLEEVRSDAEERMMEITTIIIDGGEYSDEEYLMLKELREAESIAHAKAIVTLTQAHEIARASAYGAGKAAMKAQLDAYYSEIIGRNNYTIEQLEAVVADREASIAFLNDRIERIEDAAGFEGTEFYGSDGLLQHLRDIDWMASKYDGLVAQVANLQTQVNNIPSGSTPSTTPEEIEVAGHAEEETVDEHITEYGEVYSLLNNGTLSVTGSYASVTMGSSTYQAVKVNGVWTDMPFSTVSWSGNLATIKLDTTSTNVMTLTSSGVGYAMTQLSAAGKLSLKTAIEDAVEKAYNTGFDDGYTVGYNDGYSDGYIAGQAAD